MKERLTWRETIIKMFTDENGDWKLGLDNGITAQMLLKERGMPYDPESAEGREIINRARIELNAFTIWLTTTQGYCSGSLSREPTYYLIAQNKAEKKLMAKSAAKKLIGRLDNFRNRFEGVIEIGPINKSQKLLENSAR